MVSILRAVSPALAFCFALSAGKAMGNEPSPQVWLNPGIYSYHFDRSKNYRENNIGVGTEILMGADHGFMAGTFINSDRERTRYVAYQWRPLHWQASESVTVSGGIVVGAFDGYPRMRNGGWFLAPLPVIAIEGKRLGVNFSIIPNYGERLHGAFAVQLKLRVW